MNVMIDFILCILALAIFLTASGKNTVVAFSRFFAMGIAVLLASLITLWTAAPLANVLPNPMETAAVNDLAALAETPKLADKAQTAKKIDLNLLRQEQPEALAALYGSYGVTAAQVDAAVAAGDAENATLTAAKALAQPVWHTIVSSAERLVLVVVLDLVLVLVFRSLLYHFFPKDKKRKLAPLTILFALLSAVLAVSYIAVPVLDAFRPYSMGILQNLQLDAACTHSTLYSIFQTLYIR